MSSLLRLAIGAGFAAMALAAPAHADTRTVPAGRLVLSDGLGEDTTIDADPSLSGAVRITRENGVDCLSINGGGALVIDTSRCDSDEALHIDVPPGMPIVLTATGSGDIKIGDIGGPLTLSAAGHGDVSVGRTGPLTLQVAGGGDVSVGAVIVAASLTLSGSGDVKMQSVNGALSVKQSSSGDLVIGAITSPAVDVQSTGSGDTLIGGGTIGALRVRIQGSGDFATAATSGEADLSAHGGGDMRIGPVTGTVRRDSGGGSEIHMGSSALVGSVISDVAHAIGNSSEGGHHVTVVPSGGVAHFFTLAIIGFLGFLIYRILRRSGGLPSSMRRPSQPQAPAAPTHPGVVALCDSLSRTEQRLSRVEAYVTSREFDLQQKFREMGRS